MRLNRVLLIVLSLFLFLTVATANNEPNIKDNEVKIGIYINEISNFVIKDNSLKMDFYIWFLWIDDNLKPYKTFEIMNGTIESQGETEVKKIGKFNYACKRIKARMRHLFDVSKFPLDKHILKISIEDAINTLEGFKYISDKDNSKLNDNVYIPSYSIREYQFYETTKTYSTNYGEFNLPKNNESSYSRAVFEVEIYRDDYSSFFKTFWGFFVAILIALVSFTIRPDIGARFSLSVGAIFATAAIGAMIKNYLPESDVWTLADKINMLTLFTVFLIICFSSYSLKLFNDGKLEQSKLVDKISIPIFTIFYSLIVYYLATN